MLLSVIIPVYKVEHTLDRCVESVLAQNIASMEVILVDDGSPDSCPEKCDEWAGKDNRIKVIHKRNGGPGSARNSGLDIATGDFVTFVDSDDYLLPDTYCPLVERMQKENLDMIEYAIDQQNTSIPALSSITDKVFDAPRDYWMTTMAWLHGYLCNKIFRRDIVGELRLPCKYICEDLLFLPDLLKKCRRIATTTHGMYVYTVNANGLSGKRDIKAIRGLLYAEMMVAWKMRVLPWSKNGKNAYYYMCCRLYDLLRLVIGIKL